MCWKQDPETGNESVIGSSLPSASRERTRGVGDNDDDSDDDDDDDDDYGDDDNGDVDDDNELAEVDVLERVMDRLIVVYRSFSGG